MTGPSYDAFLARAVDEHMGDDEDDDLPEPDYNGDEDDDSPSDYSMHGACP
jgi:hypothetical protein